VCSQRCVPLLVVHKILKIIAIYETDFYFPWFQFIHNITYRSLFTEDQKSLSPH
jgi:hypothetical protein